MNQFGFNPFIYEEVKRQHDELIKELTLMKQIRESRVGENIKNRNGFNLFALLGKELSRIGFSLEMRYGSQPETRAVLNQQSNTGGCS